MHTDHDSAAARPRVAGTRYARGERLRRMETWVPAAAVALVAIAAVATAVMSQRHEAPEVAIEQADESTVAQKGVVTAPPLKSPSPRAQQARATDGEPRAATQAMGAATACRNCGVVETVVAVHGYAQPEASGYQMHIRMDDGTVRTVEQRGALAAGSRVVVEHGSVRTLAQGAGQS